MSISASLVMELRKRTGAGMMECKKALVECQGDIEAAAELMRKTGAAKADKKADRIAAEGTIQIQLSDDNKRAAIVEVNCETDFVARDENFLAFAKQVAAQIFAEGEAAVQSESIETARRELIAKIGENITIRRAQIIEAQGLVASYLHGSRIGVVVDVNEGDAELARDIAMHIAASKPAVVKPEDVAKELVDKEREIFTAQANDSGKPAEIIAKMVEGRINKFLKEVSLHGQPFVKNPDQTVAQLLKEKNATVNSFVRFEVGEGIEKKQENFAEEVAAQMGDS